MGAGWCARMRAFAKGISCVWKPATSVWKRMHPNMFTRRVSLRCSIQAGKGLALLAPVQCLGFPKPCPILQNPKSSECCLARPKRIAASLELLEAGKLFGDWVGFGVGTLLV